MYLYIYKKNNINLYVIWIQLLNHLNYPIRYSLLLLFLYNIKKRKQLLFY